MAQIAFNKRKDSTIAINTAIGNVSLPMHPAMISRMNDLQNKNSPFSQGVVKYSSTVGLQETNDAFLNIIQSSGFQTNNLYSQITNGGSQAMELIILGLCGEAGTSNKPLLMIDAAYTNYKSMAERLGRSIYSSSRHLDNNGKFLKPDINEIKEIIKKNKPSAMIIIPYDNPTGAFYDHETIKTYAKLCVENNMWIVSDEAYRELHYTDDDVASVWGLTEKEVPGITNRRISIETASKVWNACGLRIGALVTDNKEFHEKCVAENTADLCSNVIGQYIFGALARESHEKLNEWYNKQRNYYSKIMAQISSELKKQIPKIIVSNPDASIYSVIDVRNIAKPNFNALDFVMFCAKNGKVSIDGKDYTLLVAPMCGFYSVENNEINPGKTQMRIAYIETPENLELVPKLFKELFIEYESLRE